MLVLGCRIIDYLNCKQEKPFFIASTRLYEGPVIERYPDRLYFSNPGTMLVSVEDFFEGGHSICRNSALHKMFEMIGGGERAGSGADTIKKGWADNKWPVPEIKEHFGQNDDRVELTLRIGQCVQTAVCNLKNGQSYIIFSVLQGRLSPSP